MSDPRLTPDATVVTERTSMQIASPVVDLCRTPTGPRDRQLLFGATLTQLNTENGWTYVQAAADGYCGYVPADALAPETTATHWVTAPCTHIYAAANLKSPDVMALSHLSRLTVIAETDAFAQTAQGFVPLQHISPLKTYASDPSAVAATYLGTDYLWGGNSRWGIDCSGLVQAALHACGIACPGDSDMQMTLGAPATPPYTRNDLLFWKGHVALVTDPATMIHANAHAMAVTLEPIDTAITRIATSGDGPVTAHRRLPPSFWL